MKDTETSLRILEWQMRETWVNWFLSCIPPIKHWQKKITLKPVKMYLNPCKLKPGQYHTWQKLNKWAVFSQEITLFTIRQDVKEYELLPCRGIMNPYHSIYHSEESPKKVSYSAGVLLSPDLHARSELTGTHSQFQWDQSTDNRYFLIY